MLIPSKLTEKLRPLRLLALDVDGVLTDGSLIFSPGGKEESKAFNTLDGLGMQLLQASGVKVALITGRNSKVTALRAEALKLDPNLVFLGRNDKITALAEIAQSEGLSWEQLAYCGDDLPDLSAIKKAGFGATVANAPEYLHKYSDYVTEREGGKGAVRELTDLIMQAQGTFSACLDHYLFNLKA